MLLKIQHSTLYRFDDPVRFGLQQVRKTPKSNDQQAILDWAIHITGGKKELSFEDHHNNLTNLISFEKDVSQLEVTCEGRVEMKESHGIVGRHRGPAPLWLYAKPTPLTAAGTGVQRLLRELNDAPMLDWLHALSNLIRETVAYEIGGSHTDWDAEEVLRQKRGVCQDHTHVFLACARSRGIPARYVSGYLMLDDRTTQDAMHAWAEAHVDDIGWVGFDISNGISPDTRYVRVATGLEYSDAAPVTGTRIGGNSESLAVRIEVVQQ